MHSTPNYSRAQRKARAQVLCIAPVSVSWESDRHTHIRDVLPLSSEVDRAYGEQAKVNEGGELETDQQRGKQLQREQPKVAVGAANAHVGNQNKRTAVRVHLTKTIVNIPRCVCQRHSSRADGRATCVSK